LSFTLVKIGMFWKTLWFFDYFNH